MCIYYIANKPTYRTKIEDRDGSHQFPFLSLKTNFCLFKNPIDKYFNKFNIILDLIEHIVIVSFALDIAIFRFWREKVCMRSP
jgi:hypothetical protein